jgi:putative transposase
MPGNYRHKTTSVTLINYHFVWIPKRRKKVLIGNVAIRLEELLYEKTKELECEILALEIMQDHVHLFVSCPPTLAPDQIMFRLKGYTSRVLRQEFRVMPQVRQSKSILLIKKLASSGTAPKGATHS